MATPTYKFAVEQCDVHEQDRGRLTEYRTFRSKCLDYLRGSNDLSVTTQVHDLVWHTMIFRSLNEARRLEHDVGANGPMWELLSAGYANLMTLGIRKLIDPHPNSNSIANIVSAVEKRPELLTRENFVCYDGLSFDVDAAFQRDFATIADPTQTSPRWLETTGPNAWSTSRLLHEAFDKMCGSPKIRKRSDAVDPSIIASVKSALSSDEINRVKTLADKVGAHAERLSTTKAIVQPVTFNDIEMALKSIVRTVNFLSGHFFYDAALGSVVPTPQFDVFEALNMPFVGAEKLPALHSFWNELATEFDGWLSQPDAEFLAS